MKLGTRENGASPRGQKKGGKTWVISEEGKKHLWLENKKPGEGRKT